MTYRYNYGALFQAPANAGNFKGLLDPSIIPDFSTTAHGLLEQQGLTAGVNTQQFLTDAMVNADGSQVKALQNIAGLSGQDTAEARGIHWGADHDDTIGRSFLEKIAGLTDEELASSTHTTDQQLEKLYTSGFNRSGDAEGLDYWKGRLASGEMDIRDVADSFSQSEEASYRSGFHDEYGREADESGLVYWMSEGAIKDGTLADMQKLDADGDGKADWTQTDSSGDFTRILQHTGDANEQKETTVRNMLSEQLGLHSTQDQRDKDSTLAGAFTSPNADMVQRMMGTSDLGAQEIADKVKMQNAAKNMGDYGGGINDVGPDGQSQATGIHRILQGAEMGAAVDIGDGTKKWMTDTDRLAMGAEDYTPKVEYNEDGTIKSESNVWGLLKSGTQDYDPPFPDGPDGPDGPEDEPDFEPDDEPDGKPTIDKKTTDHEYMPELTSDVKDTSSYGDSLAAFDNAAKNIDTPGPDMFIRSAQTMGVGGSAEGVRLKRSKKFKTGESALGTTQLGRKLQIQSLNI